MFTRWELCVGENRVIPKWRGVAWREWSRLEVVTYPIGLHLLARWARSLWLWFLYHYEPTKFESLLIDEFWGGARRGREEQDRAAKAYREAYQKHAEQVEAAYWRGHGHGSVGMHNQICENLERFIEARKGGPS